MTQHDSLETLVPATDKSWTIEDAAHLLSRAQFGYSPEELDEATADGRDATVQRLVGTQAESTEFAHADATLSQTAISTGNINDLKIWWLYRMRFSANSLTEKLSLFWHNHFATSNAKVNSVPYMLAQNNLIRTHALGDFKQLLHGMSRDTAMLIWLDGNANRKRHPNENFAREIMELFALGVGSYTERDIQEAARAFTGWHIRDGAFWKNLLQHDGSPKTVLGQTGPFDGNEIVNLCLSQPACPRFLAKKLARTFVCPNPSADAVEMLAGSIRRHDFDFQRVMQELFASTWFYQPSNRRALIKSPLDLVLGTLRAIAGPIRWPGTVMGLAELGQNILEPPSVKGWEGGRLWITSSTLLRRANFATELATTDEYGPLSETVRNAASRDSPKVVELIERWLMIGGLSQSVRHELIMFHTQAAGSPDEKLRGLLQFVCFLPEYQLH